MSYLSIEWILLKVIGTLKISSVCLTHDEIVFQTVEDVNLVNDVFSTRSEISKSIDENLSPPFPSLPKSASVLHISVFIDHLRKPELVNFLAI